MTRMLDVQEVMDLTGLSRTTIWRREKAGEFPQRREVSPRRVGWLDTEITEWLATRPKGIRPLRGERTRS